MRYLFLLVSWIFGIIFFISSAAFFYVNDYILGNYAIIMGLIIVLPIHKYIEEFLEFHCTKAQIVFMGFVLYLILFANFMRPVFFANENDIKAYKKYADTIQSIETPCINAIMGSKKFSCSNSRKIYDACSVSIPKSNDYMKSVRYDINIPKPLALVASFQAMTLGETAMQKLNITKTNLKNKCGIDYK